jgi:hypothetical protein
MADAGVEIPKGDPGALAEAAGAWAAVAKGHGDVGTAVDDAT